MSRRFFRRAAARGVVLGLALAAGLAVRPAAAEECHGTPSPVKVVVVVDNVRTSEGLMAVTIYQEKGFLKKGGSLKVWRDPAKAGVQTVCLFLPQPGTFAFAVFQDLNSDHKLAYNLFRGPTEPWGFSNNPRAIWPLPFSRVAVAAPAGVTTLHVKLNY
jgi:uncharacterized protein (DUF2141 family)